MALFSAAQGRVEAAQGQNGNMAFEHKGDKIQNVAGHATIRSSGRYQANAQQSSFDRAQCSYYDPPSEVIDYANPFT